VDWDARARLWGDRGRATPRHCIGWRAGQLHAQPPDPVDDGRSSTGTPQRQSAPGSCVVYRFRFVIGRCGRPRTGCRSP